MSSACPDRRLVALGLLVLVVATPALAGPAELRVCADPNNLPFSNDKGEGFENRIAEIVARDLGQPLEYFWMPQRRGFIRSTLNADQCDLVMGVPASSEALQPTRPYYRSTYVFVSRRDRALRVTSFDDPRLRTVDDRSYASLKYTHSFPDVVDVTAQQFSWLFKYPAFRNASSSTLRLPVHRTVELRLVLEMCVLRLATLPPLLPVEDILRRLEALGAGGAAAPAAPASAATVGWSLMTSQTPARVVTGRIRLAIRQISSTDASLARNWTMSEPPSQSCCATSRGFRP